MQIKQSSWAGMACALVLFLFGAYEAARAGEKITLRLAYTSDSNGYIDACG